MSKLLSETNGINIPVQGVDQVFRLTATCQRLGISRSTYYKLLRQGILDLGFKIGKRARAYTGAHLQSMIVKLSAMVPMTVDGGQKATDAEGSGYPPVDSRSPAAPYAIYLVKAISLSRQSKTKACDLAGALRHNLRLIPSDREPGSSIRPSESHKNTILAGSNSVEEILAVANAQKAQIAQVNARKLRYDHVQAVEVVVSLNTDLDNNLAFFQACTDWAGEYFGQKAILSSVVHSDEVHPHVHILISPVHHGRVAGDELKNPRALQLQKRSFFDKVAASFGVRMSIEKLSKRGKRRASDCVFAHLKQMNSPLMSDAAWPAIKDSIRKDPIRYVSEYGLNLSFEVEKPRTFAQIFTSKGAGKNRPEDAA